MFNVLTIVTKMSLTQRHFCRETTSNNLEAQDQSLGLCLFLGVFLNQLPLARWTVNPYVASSGLARGASFLDDFLHSHRYCNDVNISLVEIWSSTFSAVKRSSGGNFRPAGSM